MKRKIIRLVIVCIVFGAACSGPNAGGQRGNVDLDWKKELAKAQTGIENDPRSAFWHNQAGVAYDALGDFDKAVEELKLAATLDPADPIHDYALYALYKRKSMYALQRQVLLDALERDPKNPMGRFEFAFLLEKESHWADALREYTVAKQLAANVTGPEYVDPRGNPYPVGMVREEVDKAIVRVSKEAEPAQTGSKK